MRSQNGVSFLGLLTILFIGLKLGGVIAWPWFLVLMPLLAPMGLIAILFAVCLLIAIVQVWLK